MAPPTQNHVRWKRSRASCDLCRRMKIRCDRNGEKCSACRARDIECNVTAVETRKPRRKKTDPSNSIEVRIERMESLLQSSGIIVNSPQPRSESSSSKAIEEQTSPKHVDDLANLVINDAGSQKFIGASSGFSLLSPRGLDWVQRKTGSDRLAGALRKLKSKPEIWPEFTSGDWWWNGRNFTSHVIPSREVAEPLVNYYFNYFNATFPLFDRKTFSSYFDRHYSNDPPTCKSWYGALNIVLSIGCVIATDPMTSGTTTGGNTSRENLLVLSWRFFQNSSSVFTDLLFADNGLMGIGTILGMAFIMEAVMNPEASFVLISAAVRLAHGMGVHRWLEGFGLSQSELNQRRLVFWVMYIIDKSTSLRIGRPSVINDDDIGVPLPPEDMADDGSLGISVASNSGRKFYPFRSACTIAVLESKVYSELYSARSWTKTPEDRLSRVSRLDQELEDWKNSIPIELRPEHPIRCEQEAQFRILMLHFVYYNCLTAIHRVSIHHGSWTSKAETHTDVLSSESSPESSAGVGSTSKPRVYASYALCLSAARSTIHIATQFLGLHDDPRNSMIWIAIYFPLTACLTLFAHTLQSPHDPRVDDDLNLLERTLQYLYRTMNMGPREKVSATLDVFGDLVTLAREYVMNIRGHNVNTETIGPNIFVREKGSINEAAASILLGTGTNHPNTLTPSTTDLRDSIPQLGDPSTSIIQPDWSSQQALEFFPLNLADPDLTLEFAYDWSRYYYDDTRMDPGDEFH